MNKYENGMIYMIESPSAKLIYYGSTCMPLSKRLSSHKNKYKNFKNGCNKFMASFNILDNDDYKIVLVEKYPCENKQQLFAREAYYIRNNECVNKAIPNRTNKEYYQDNKQKIDNVNKAYYENNIEHIKELARIRYLDNKEKIDKQHKEYYENNKECRRQYNRDHYKKTKENITCQCGESFLKKNTNRHNKSKKHIEFINKMT